MVEIISKREGPRKEDVAAKQFLRNNRAAIDGIADHLTGGRWRALRNPVRAPQPEPSGKLWYIPPGRPAELEPYVRISLNGRVVVADLASGRQIHFLGELRGERQSRRLALATAQNGFFAPLEDHLHAALADLEGLSVPDEASEQRLEQELAIRLGLSVVGQGIE
ncbi:hypothetical protein [Bradyrhizobium cenepequi]